MSMACALAFSRADVAVAAYAFDQLVANREGRVQRGHGFLENHGHAVAAQGAHGVRPQRGEVGAFKADGPGGNAALALGQQAHDGQRGHAFAAARFTDDAQRAAGIHRKTDAVHRGEFTAAFKLEAGAQAAHLQQSRHAAAPLRSA
jgi:hypothetical protein